MTWLVATDHPYYPEIDMFEFQEEAEAFAKKQYDEYHENDGNRDLTIHVALVSSTKSGQCYY